MSIKLSDNTQISSGTGSFKTITGNNRSVTREILSDGGNNKYAEKITFDGVNNQKFAIALGYNPSMCNSSCMDNTNKLICAHLYSQGYSGYYLINLYSNVSSNKKFNNKTIFWRYLNDILSRFVNNLFIFGGTTVYVNKNIIDAFDGCSSLTSIEIPADVTSISDATFRDCTSLTSVIISNSVKRTEYNAFYNCGALERVYYTGTAEEWSSIIFNSGNDPLTSATVYYLSNQLTDEQKADGNNYWHYVDGVPTVWTKETT